MKKANQSVQRVVSFLDENPEYVGALELALEAEGKHEKEKYWLGWEWEDVCMQAVRLNKLIVEGIIKVSYKSHSSKHYKLVHSKTVVLALDSLSQIPEASEEPLEEVEILDNIFDVVVGYEDVKSLILKGLRSSRSVHFLLWGLPGTAKSLILDCIRTLPNSVLVLGSSLTKVGLRDVIMDNPSPEIILCMDEIEKVDNPRDLDILLRVMQTGEIVKTIHGTHQKETKRIHIVATANQVKRLTPEIKSRFIVFRFRQYTDEEFMEVGRRVLTMLEGAGQEIADYIPGKVIRILGSHDVRDCVKIFRLGGETRDEVDRVIKILKTYR